MVQMWNRKGVTGEREQKHIKFTLKTIPFSNCVIYSWDIQEGLAICCIAYDLARYIFTYLEYAEIGWQGEHPKTFDSALKQSQMGKAGARVSPLSPRCVK